MKAIVNVPICALLAAPTRESTLEDEALYGMVVEILEEPVPGWYRVRTHYRYEGIVSADDLIVGDEAADAWAALPKKIVRNKNFCDVLSAPKVQGWIMATLPRGGILSPVGQPEKGWQQVRLADGRTGFVPESIVCLPGDVLVGATRKPFVRHWWTPPCSIGVPTTAGAASPPWALTAPVWCPRPICSAAFLFTGTPISWRTFPFTKFLWKM